MTAKGATGNKVKENKNVKNEFVAALDQYRNFSRRKTDVSKK